MASPINSSRPPSPKTETVALPHEVPFISIPPTSSLSPVPMEARTVTSLPRVRRELFPQVEPPTRNDELIEKCLGTVKEKVLLECLRREGYMGPRAEHFYNTCLRRNKLHLARFFAEIMVKEQEETMRRNQIPNRSYRLVEEKGPDDFDLSEAAFDTWSGGFAELYGSPNPENHQPRFTSNIPRGRRRTNEHFTSIR